MLAGPTAAALTAAALLAAFACGGGSAVETPAATEGSRPANGDPSPAAAARSHGPRVVALGDSLTAGLGLPPEQAYPALLQERIRDAGLDFEVVNAGISGDTSAGGLRRLDWSLDGNVRVLILALGANDGLRGLPVTEMRKNLGEIIEQAKSRGAAVILAGMEAPPNFGAAYTAEFRRAYRDLASEHQVTLVPFLLEGVAGVASLNQRDGIHPTAEGARIIADTIWTALQPILAKTSARDGA